jgi:DNA-binding response OmpR family regulator
MDPAPTQATPEAGAPHAPAVVLVVAGDKTIRATLRAALAPHFRVAAAGDGHAAAREVSVRVPDAIVVDLREPRGQEGPRLARLQRVSPSRCVPTLVLTADPDHAAAALDGATFATIPTPVTDAELVGRTQAAIDADVHPDPPAKDGHGRFVAAAATTRPPPDHHAALSRW